jgi:hypothetical protein
MAGDNASSRSQKTSAAGSRPASEKLGISIREQPWSDPIVLALMLGLLAVSGFAFGHGGWRSVAIGVILASSSLAVGGITGFLFGIPRAVQSAPTATAKGIPDTEYQTNTNLEQISDWLTKIIVGLGLSQINRIPSATRDLAEYVSTAFGSPAVPSSLVASALLYFSIMGFLAFYLWTRLLLTGEFSRADRAARQSPEFAEGLIQALLYQPAPEGFKAAIDNGEAYLLRYGTGNWRVWRSLACAYAQKYAYLKAAGGGEPTELAAAHDKALEAVRRVLALDADECAALVSLWDPALATPQENDLVVFAEDAEFAKVFAQCADARKRR